MFGGRKRKSGEKRLDKEMAGGVGNEGSFDLERDHGIQSCRSVDLFSRAFVSLFQSPIMYIHTHAHTRARARVQKSVQSLRAYVVIFNLDIVRDLDPVTFSL